MESEKKWGWSFLIFFSIGLGGLLWGDILGGGMLLGFISDFSCLGLSSSFRASSAYGRGVDATCLDGDVLAGRHVEGLQVGAVHGEGPHRLVRDVGAAADGQRPQHRRLAEDLQQRRVVQLQRPQGGPTLWGDGLRNQSNAAHIRSDQNGDESRHLGLKRPGQRK